MYHKMKSEKQVRNPQGIEVRKCCASCKFRLVFGTDGIRFCIKRNKEVKKLGLCKHWEMRDDLQQACYTNGKVKSRAYLRNVYEVRLQESRLIENGKLEPDQVVGIRSLREEYEEQHDASLFSIN